MMRILLAGNPNCGKTTLFNALTGDNQRVGNWSGVTVEKKTGEFTINENIIYVTDLPGVYSLVTSSENSSQDAQIAATAVVQGDTDVIVNVVDACHLERHLYLTSQLLELGYPLILVINMMDIAAQRGISIDAQALSAQLHCPVVMLQAHRNVGIAELKQAISLFPSHELLSAESPSAELSSSRGLTAGSIFEARSLDPAVKLRDDGATPLNLAFPPSVQNALTVLEQELVSSGENPALVPYIARRMLEGADFPFSHSHQKALKADENAFDFDILIANARYDAIHNIVTNVQKKRSDTSEHFTAKIDRIVLHRVWALPIFFGMMYLMFLLAINLGGAFQDFFDITTDTVFVKGTAWLLQRMQAPGWLIALCADGIGKGINTTLTFIPVMASMYFFLSLLEASGYMARAAFVVDRVMRMLGLPGKSFVPMIVGFGCNVPAIMAARTLDSERDRVLTVLMSPFMSCSARLAIYAVFVAAFFPTGGQNVVFSLYLIGILMAVLTGFLLRKTVLKGQTSPLILELPAYHRPSLRRLMKETGLRLRYFITRAGKFITPVCVILGGLNALTIHGGISGGVSSESVLSMLGQWLTPIFAPMGIHQDNWPATVGLLTGTLAKEVVVGSLNTLYAQMGHLVTAAPAQFEFWGSLQTALLSIPQNLASLGNVLADPLISPALSNAPGMDASQSVYGIMYQQFDGKAGAYAYLLFILLYIPCVSTMAAIRQETNSKLMWFSIAWSFMVAYGTAVAFYQLATFTTHPWQTIEYLIATISCIALVISFIRVMAQSQGARHAAANS